VKSDIGHPRQTQRSKGDPPNSKKIGHTIGLTARTGILEKRCLWTKNKGKKVTAARRKSMEARKRQNNRKSLAETDGKKRVKDRNHRKSSKEGVAKEGGNEYR